MAVATNQMRREAAKRKLARQRERRAAQARRRRQFTVIGSVVAVVVVVVGVVLYATLGNVGRGHRRRGHPHPRSGGHAHGRRADPGRHPHRGRPAPKRPDRRSRPRSPAASRRADRPRRRVKPPSGTDVSAQGTVGITLQTGDGPSR